MRIAGAIICLASCTAAYADLAQLPTGNSGANAAAAALNRISQSRAFSFGAAPLTERALDPASLKGAAHTSSNMIYYANLQVPASNIGAGGGVPPTGGGYTRPGDNGVVNGGGGGGSSGGQNNNNNPRPPVVPSPGAATLALLGMVVVEHLRKRRQGGSVALA